MAEPTIVEGASALVLAAELRAGFVRALERVHRRRGPVVVVRYPRRWGSQVRQVALVADPAVARGVLMDPAAFTDLGTYPRLGPPDCAHRRLREGIIFANGEAHACQRRRVLPALAPAAVEALAPRITALCAEEMAGWPAEGTIDCLPLAKRLLRRLSLELLFGETDLALGLKVAGALETHADLSLSLPAILAPFDWPGLPFHRLMRQADDAEAILLGWIGERRRRPTGGSDMLTALLEAASDEGGRGLSDRQAAAQLWTLYGASFHTLSASLAWLIVLLAQHPAEAATLRSAFEDAAPLSTPPPVLNAIQEAMRLMTPVPFQMRRAASQTVLPRTAHPLAERDTIVVSNLVMNRCPKRFGPDPDAFRPARWTEAGAPSAADVFAFSAGPRFCPGRSFAFGVLGAALRAMLGRWSFSLAPGQRLTDRTAITLSPRRVVVRLAPRGGAFERVKLRGRARNLSPAI